MTEIISKNGAFILQFVAFHIIMVDDFTHIFETLSLKSQITVEASLKRLN